MTLSESISDTGPHNAEPEADRPARKGAEPRRWPPFRSVMRWLCPVIARDDGMLPQRILDYTIGGVQLFWQRMTMYLGAALLAGFYFDPKVAAFCFLLVVSSEVYDTLLARRILATREMSQRDARRFLHWIALGTLFSAGAVSTFAVLVARMEGAGAHFTSLFMLFAAGLFATMYNHQLLGVLILRLVIYGATFIYIPARDLWIDAPEAASPLSLQLLVVLFVLYFLIDCSMVFLRMYRQNLRHLQKLQEEHERTRAAYEAKSQFLSIISHELRTPLTSMLGSVRIMGSGTVGEIPEKARPLLDIATRNGERLEELINDLLDLQKMEAGQMRYEMEPVDLAEVVADTVESCSSFARIHGVTHVTRLPAAPVMVRGDRTRLSQVITNILSNATKFSPKGGTVEIRLLVRDGRARVEIADQGPGIPPGMKDRVFGRFTQVDATDQRKVGGTGLGMSISLNIMREHGGVIDYDSTPGKGTTFFIELDLLDEAAAPMREAAE